MESGAKIFLENLKELGGVDKIFIVSGTDYAAFIEEKAKDGALPEFIVVPHEITATAAAMGYSLGGKTGVAAVHTIPGTLNALGIIVDAYTSRIPLIVIAGRSPYTEEGHEGSRNLRIHWTQEARDQGTVVRQWIKWDFEIRKVEQIPEAIARGIQLAYSEPRGPVYITIPREVSVEKTQSRISRKLSTFEPGARLEDIRTAQRMIEESERPIILTWRAGRRKEWFDEMKKFVDNTGIPVVHYIGEVVNYEGDFGLYEFDITNSDLVIVVENEVPWIPKKVGKINAKVIRVDVDPSYSYIPFYGFPCDLCIQSTVSDFFSRLKVNEKKEWKEKVLEIKSEQDKKKIEEIERLSKGRDKIHPRLLSYMITKLSRELLGDQYAIFNEYPFNPKYAKLHFGQYFSDPAFGHLGWSLGASFGFSLATNKKVIATVGDGSFIFGVPDAFYYAVRSYGGDVTVIIYDNGGWLASAEATAHVYPEGEARKRQNYPGADFKRYNIGEGVRAYGGFYKVIEEVSELEYSLKEAILNRGLSVLQVIVEKTR
ncbi:thiamine pyrophosphate-requiring protein [Sulfolobus acidocaldarius]|uniref:2-oxoacid oxidoreductase (ferredoxin) n=4 Tax=Sulfolobus acidocaldarius TaxID=2285 RepID=Q4J6L3_SULAC|nr:thiamine pyrophosphate-requiring protein [Sulfolobus acidocaldarius]AAY81567.1 acetolactate synthase large subunit [Sulfolobus acidocaldarius DSM 639]AGE72170.1 acetolactate synthase catalytic subunit [Sulfolobus acidocaldarius N8]AGE74487.1 acetolactate synthase catalytic subunit [Sulfolobus acidocaldarius Ron12/I]ALU29658.1 acetolactate synthase catalytic subunit [Sulfolobus acidocaldarius]ALU32393.1 acetolactate synthase catalytic subunit [Sulfolobus acidocaldarius]